MATMPRTRPERSGRRGARAAATLLLAGLPLGAAVGQVRQVEFGVGTDLTWTSNSSFGVSDGESDAALQVQPRVRVRSEGARVRINGSAAVSALTYANGTQRSRTDPTADIQARLEAIERLFFVEVGYRAAQTSGDVFGAQPDTASTANTLTTSQWRVSPFLEGQAGPDLRYRLRSDNSWTREIGETTVAPAAGGYFGRHGGSIEQDPRPFGWRLEAERSITRYDNPLEDEVIISLARGIVSYAPTPEWSVGLRAGQERNNVAAGEQKRRTLYGAESRWQPTPRTTLSVSGERRFFGNAWSLAFDHRRPLLAWSIAANRGVDTTPQSLFDLPATDNVAGLLDAMFTTRYPNPAERAQVVADFIEQQGLPRATSSPRSLFAPRFSLVTSRRASVSFIGVRHTLTVSGYAIRTEDALESGPFALGDVASNNSQRGASAVLSHRLTPLTSLTMTANWSRIRALNASDETTEQGLRIQFSMQLAPQTTGVFGARYRKLDSSIAFEGHEDAVFLGLDHRF